MILPRSIATRLTAFPDVTPEEDAQQHGPLRKNQQAMSKTLVHTKAQTGLSVYAVEIGMFHPRLPLGLYASAMNEARIRILDADDEGEMTEAREAEYMLDFEECTKMYQSFYAKN